MGRSLANDCTQRCTLVLPNEYALSSTFGGGIPVGLMMARKNVCLRLVLTMMLVGSEATETLRGSSAPQCSGTFSVQSAPSLLLIQQKVTSQQDIHKCQYVFRGPRGSDLLVIAKDITSIHDGRIPGCPITIHNDTKMDGTPWRLCGHYNTHIFRVMSSTAVVSFRPVFWGWPYTLTVDLLVASYGGSATRICGDAELHAVAAVPIRYGMNFRSYNSFESGGQICDVKIFSSDSRETLKTNCTLTSPGMCRYEIVPNSNGAVSKFGEVLHAADGQSTVRLYPGASSGSLTVTLPGSFEPVKKLERPPLADILEEMIPTPEQTPWADVLEGMSTIPTAQVTTDRPWIANTFKGLLTTPHPTETTDPAQATLKRVWTVISTSASMDRPAQTNPLEGELAAPPPTATTDRPPQANDLDGTSTTSLPAAKGGWPSRTNILNVTSTSTPPALGRYRPLWMDIIEGMLDVAAPTATVYRSPHTDMLEKTLTATPPAATGVQSPETDVMMKVSRAPPSTAATDRPSRISILEGMPTATLTTEITDRSPRADVVGGISTGAPATVTGGKQRWADFEDVPATTPSTTSTKTESSSHNPIDKGQFSGNTETEASLGDTPDSLEHDDVSGGHGIDRGNGGSATPLSFWERTVQWFKGAQNTMALAFRNMKKWFMRRF